MTSTPPSVTSTSTTVLAARGATSRLAGSIQRIHRFKHPRPRLRPLTGPLPPAIDANFGAFGILKQKICLTDRRCLEFAIGEGYFLFAAPKPSSSIARALGSGLALYPC